MMDMGLTEFSDDDDDLYESRKADMLHRIRLRWQKRGDLDPKSEQQQKQLKEWIDPLVRSWPVGTEPFNLRDVQRRLEFYTSWAFTINWQSRDEQRKKDSRITQDSTQVRTAGPSTSKNEFQLHNTTTDKDADIQKGVEGLKQGGIGQPHSDTQQTLGSFFGISAVASQTQDLHTTSTVHPASIGSTTTTLDWDAIEIAIDARVIGLGTVWLPMIDIKPDAAGPYHWSDFDITKLREHIENDTEKKIDMTIHNLVYQRGFNEVVVNARGSYKIALKWFVERGEGRGKIFHLSVRPKDGALGTGSSQIQKLQESPWPTRQARANKSQFDGASSDFSNEG